MNLMMRSYITLSSGNLKQLEILSITIGIDYKIKWSTRFGGTLVTIAGIGSIIASILEKSA